MLCMFPESLMTYHGPFMSYFSQDVTLFFHGLAAINSSLPPQINRQKRVQQKKEVGEFREEEVRVVKPREDANTLQTPVWVHTASQWIKKVMHKI